MLSRRNLKIKAYGNLRTFKTKINALFNMLTSAAKSNLEVKVNKNSHPKLSISQSLSKPLKYIRSSSHL